MQDTDVRHYQAPKEAVASKNPAAPHGGKSAARQAGAPTKLAWTLPDGWSQSEGPRSMRLATFQALAPAPKTTGGGEAGDAAPATTKAECTLIALSGTAGGVAANVNRWRGQIGLPAQDAAAIEAAGERLPTGLGEARVWRLVNVEGSDSLIAALIPPKSQGGMTYFVKLKAPTASIQSFAEGFEAFTRSLRPQGAPAAKPTKGAAKADGKPDAKGAAKADGKPDAKGAAKADGKPDAKGAAKADGKPDAKGAAKADAKSDTTPQPKP